MALKKIPASTPNAHGMADMIGRIMRWSDDGPEVFLLTLAAAFFEQIDPAERDEALNEFPDQVRGVIRDQGPMQ